jgi:uroporphyrinogen decarboxylase
MKGWMAGSEKRLLAVLNQQRRVPPPIWLMRQAGRYLPEYRALRSKARDFLHFCYTPELANKATLQPIARFDLDAAIIFSDILVIPHALGRDVRFVENEGPLLGVLRQDDALPELDSEGFLAHLAPVYQALRGVRAGLAGDKALIGFAGAPWTLACYMIDGKSRKDANGVAHFDTALHWATERPEHLAQLIDLLCDAVVLHCVQQIDAGADVIQLFDSWAGLLNAQALARFSIEPCIRIAHNIASLRPHTPVIVFPRETGPATAQYAISGAFAGISIDGTVGLDFAREQLQSHCTVQGNLDPAVLVAGGAAMEKAAQIILDELGGGPFVFNLGHGVVPQTPPEHVARLVALVRSAR